METHKPSLASSRRSRMLWIFAAVALLIVAWVLQSQIRLLFMAPPEVRSFVLSVTPIGTSRENVERALIWRFWRTWKVVDYEGVELMSRQNFNARVVEGDYYLRSNFVIKPLLIGAQVITVIFLFDERDRLKDVAVAAWTDGP